MQFYGSFLLDPNFWSRIGFLISYIATSLIALEVLRLVYTDVNKRDVEKFLESYSKQRNKSASPARSRARSQDVKKVDSISVNIDALETGRPVTPPQQQERVQRVRAAATPDEKLERRKRATSSASASREHAQRTSSPSPAPTPLRKLRKRSDTLTSTGSSESRRRHREASPASESGSRHGSPRPRSREEKERKSGLGMGLGLGRVVRGKV